MNFTLLLFILLLSITSSIALLEDNEKNVNFLLYSVQLGEGYFARLLVLLRVVMFHEKLVEKALQNGKSRPHLVLPPFCTTESESRLSDFVDIDALSDFFNSTVFDFQDHRRVREKISRNGLVQDADVGYFLNRKSSDLSKYYCNEYTCSNLERDSLSLMYMCWPITLKKMNCIDMFSDMYEEKLFDKVLKHFLNDEEIQQNDNNVQIQSCEEELDDEVSAEDDDSAYADDDDEENQNNLKAKSIILLHAETMGYGVHWQRELMWKAHAAIKSSSILREKAAKLTRQLRRGLKCDRNDDFCLVTLNGAVKNEKCRKFALSIHWRRNDFVRAHPDVTPDTTSMAAQIAFELHKIKSNNKCILLMTDANKKEKSHLSNLLGQSGNRVMMVQQNNPALLKPAHVIVETELAIAAERFHGTEFSSVSYWITAKRHLAGFADDFSGLIEK